MTSTKGGTTLPTEITNVIINEPFAIQAIPNSGYDFKTWGVVSGSANIEDQSKASTIVYPESDVTIRAEFEDD